MRKGSILRQTQVIGNRRVEPRIPGLIDMASSTWWSGINEGMYPPPIRFGSRSIGWLGHEVDALVSAISVGLNKAQLQAMVRALVAARGTVVSWSDDAIVTLVRRIKAETPNQIKSGPKRSRKVRVDATVNAQEASDAPA